MVLSYKQKIWATSEMKPPKNQKGVREFWAWSATTENLQVDLLMQSDPWPSWLEKESNLSEQKCVKQALTIKNMPYWGSHPEIS